MCCGDVSPTFERPTYKEMEKTMDASNFVAQHVKNKDKFESVSANHNFQFSHIFCSSKVATFSLLTTDLASAKNWLNVSAHSQFPRLFSILWKLLNHLALCALEIVWATICQQTSLCAFCCCSPIIVLHFLVWTMGLRHSQRFCNLQNIILFCHLRGVAVLRFWLFVKYIT